MAVDSRDGLVARTIIIDPPVGAGKTNEIALAAGGAVYPLTGLTPGAIYRVMANAGFHINWDNTANAQLSDYFIPANKEIWFRQPAGVTRLSVIRFGAGDVFITRMIG